MPGIERLDIFTIIPSNSTPELLQWHLPSLTKGRFENEWKMIVSAVVVSISKVHYIRTLLEIGMVL